MFFNTAHSFLPFIPRRRISIPGKYFPKIFSPKLCKGSRSFLLLDYCRCCMSFHEFYCLILVPRQLDKGLFSCLLDIYVEGKCVSTSLTVTTIEVKGTLYREHLLLSRGTSKQCPLFPMDLVVRHVMACLGTAVSFSQLILKYFFRCICNFHENETW